MKTDENTDLLGSLCELFDAELVVKVSSDQKVVDSSPEPDEGIGDPNHHHLLLLGQPIPLGAVRTDGCHRGKAWGSETSQNNALV